MRLECRTLLAAPVERGRDDVAPHHRLEIRGGWLTGPAWLFAKIFYDHRKRQLNRLVARDFQPLAPLTPHAP